MEKNYVISRPSDRAVPKQIDYEKMKHGAPLARARVEEAVKTGDPVRVAVEVLAAVKLWEACGAWPDNWSYAQRALDDVLPWRDQVDLDDLVAGRVTITRAE